MNAFDVPGVTETMNSSSGKNLKVVNPSGVFMEFKLLQVHLSELTLMMINPFFCSVFGLIGAVSAL